MDVSRVQRRTLALLVTTQIIGGVGVAIGISVGALLAAALAGTGFSGLAASAPVVGAALLAVPATRLIRAYGRRPGLAFVYGAGTVGSLIVVAGAVLRSPMLVLVGMALFGGGTAANLQARYAAVDLARPARRGRDLSIVVWATTVGAVAGPNLSPLAESALRPFGFVRYSAPFAFAALAFGVAAVTLWLLLRPDPLQVARSRTVAVDPVDAPAPRGAGLRQALGVVRTNPSARLGIAAVSVGHVMMIAVMSMTPVYITGYVHGDVLQVVGIVLSLHIAGMFACSPLVGWLSDRVGRRPVILGGVATLLAACAVAGTAAHRTPALALGLTLLGLGWSATMVAGSTLLSESAPAAVRPSVQGLADLVMGLAGASAGAVSGLVVDWAGYPTLTALTAVMTVPLLALALRRAPRLAFSEGD